MADESSTEAPGLSPIVENGGTRLGELLRETLAESTPAGVTLATSASEDGRTLTLETAVGVRLADVSTETATAASVLLLELCASFDEVDLRVGLTGEYDDVYLFRTLTTAALDGSQVVGAAQSMLGQAAGLRQLLLDMIRREADDDRTED